MEVYPLSTTLPDWRQFNELFKELMGDRPTRGLDDTYLNFKDPAAFLACLDGKNKPLEALRNYSPFRRHIHISFIVIWDKLLFQTVNIINQLDLIITPYSYNDKTVCLLTGDVERWVHVLHRQFDDKDLTEMLSHIRNYFMQTGYRECLH